MRAFGAQGSDPLWNRGFSSCWEFSAASLPGVEQSCVFLPDPVFATQCNSLQGIPEANKGLG
jgi:hypothetical protein